MAASGAEARYTRAYEGWPGEDTKCEDLQMNTGAGLQGRQGDWGERIGEYGRNKEWRLGSAGLTFARSLPTMESSRWVREGARASQDERKDRSAFAKDGDERRACTLRLFLYIPFNVPLFKLQAWHTK
ncbi:hypothetical protein DFH09DRAFT_1068560 [Mycena vulgaris]|nr:hypothetical protein DFH09DRAFT_1068560 [Mycena vulgaris]